MQLQDIQFGGQRLIEAYGDMGFRLSDGRVEGSILIVPGAVHRIDARSNADFDRKLLEPVFAISKDIEIMILGTGKTQIFPTRQLANSFMENNIALEAMDTSAACRTFNILVSEERRVAAALIAV